jgi:hypothetical protein
MGSWESVVREVRSLIEAETGPPELSTNLWDQGNFPLVRILINSELKDLQSYNNVCNQVLDASFYGNVISCNLIGEIGVHFLLLLHRVVANIPQVFF